MNELQLIQLCIQGDRAAQKMLYDCHVRSLYGVCRRYARHDFEAKDMLQEGFIRIFDNLKSYKGDGVLAAWLRKVMVSSALRFLQKSYFQKESLPEFLPEYSYDDDVLGSLSVEEMLAHLRTLPEQYRAVFNLFAIEGYSHAEIGQIIGIEEVTSRSHLNRARKMLQTLILQEKPFLA
jgi:RNA polymerase sigma factor (sigma-70 family)